MTPPDTSTWTPEDNPVLNSPYLEPGLHWSLDENNRATQPLLEGRRESMGILSVPDEQTSNRAAANSSDNEQQAMNLEQMVRVDNIRRLVRSWRKNDYPGATRSTKDLLHHWRAPEFDPDEAHQRKRLFFAQLEAIETLIYLTEVADSETADAKQIATAIREASSSENDGLHRLAVKMATGSGKTVVMAMVIVWHAVNRHKNGGDPNRYQRNFLAIAPGLTVRDRLAVLVPGSRGNVYDDPIEGMSLLPPGYEDALGRVNVFVSNYHRFALKKRFSELTKDARGVIHGPDHKPVEITPEAMLRQELRGMSGLSIFGEGGTEKVCVLNDEAHHCYKPGKHTGAEGKEDDKKAAIWYTALKLLRDADLLGPVYDFSATPMFIETSARKAVQMFPWVVSDFPLLDAIESGLVKIPRVPISDDIADEEVRWRHLFKYSFLDSDGNPKSTKLDLSYVPPPLANAVNALYGSYERTHAQWEEGGRPTPPVFIVVANTVENAEALYRYLTGWTDSDGTVHPPACPLFSNDGDEVRTLLVHSKLDEEDKDIPATLGRKMLLKEQAERLKFDEEEKTKDQVIMRDALNTVGRVGGRGEKVRCVVSVSMLTEGWDTRTVTHILGFRAFGTQLLCEQVTGRALRRVDYDVNPETGLLPHYPAEVLGVPFNFVSPSTGGDPVDPPTVYDIYTLANRSELRMELPVVEGYTPSHTFIGFDFNPGKALAPKECASKAQIAGIVGTIDELSAMPYAPQRQQQVLFGSAAALVRRITSRWDAFVGEHSDRMARRSGLFQDAVQAVEGWFGHHNVYGDPGLAYLTQAQLADYVAEAVFAGCVPKVPDKSQLWQARYPTDRSHRLIDTFGDGDPNAPGDNRFPDMAPGGMCFTSALTARYPALTGQARLGEEPPADQPAAEGVVTLRSELNRAPCDSLFEATVAELLDTIDGVQAWVRNYKLNWRIPYLHEGRLRHYLPDFVARIGCDPEHPDFPRDPAAVHLIVEVKGVQNELTEIKKRAVLERWIPAVEGTADTPDYLRHWQFVELSNPGLAEEELREAITEAQERSAAVRRQAELRAELQAA